MIKTRLLALALLFVMPVAFNAQTHDTMPIVVQADRILIGTEFIPLFLTAANRLVVPVGATFELDADSTWGSMEVAGTLRVSRAHDTALRVTHLFVLPGGRLDMGTVADPIPCGISVDLSIRDVRLDTVTDPFQWGNGLLNFGTQTRVGCAKTAHTTAVGDLKEGDSTITLSAAPQGWKPGDEILIPDTRQPAPQRQPLRETRSSIASISGTTVTLSKPLDFDHPAPRDPNGVVVSLPYVANLSRNITVRSENPAGTAGHTADVGHMATWDIRYNRIVGLGRTRNEPLADAVRDTALPSGLASGKNQRGRYADHHHHAQGFGSVSIGNVLIGNPDPPVTDPSGIVTFAGQKWGEVIHNVHDARIEENIAIDFPGAGFVTEDGNETRNVFRHNLAAYNLGNHTGIPGCESTNIKNGNPGACGSGFFLRGIRGTFERNIATNNAIGIDLFNIDDSGPVLFYPSTPGGDADTAVDIRQLLPISFTDNAGNSNTVVGDENWFVPDFPNVRQQAIFNGIFQFLQGTSNPARPNFVDPLIVGQGGTTVCLASSLAYAQTFKVKGGRVLGCETGLADGGANDLVDLDGVTFQNVLDINYHDLPRQTKHTNVTHVPLPGHPPQFIQFGRDLIWDGVGPLLSRGGSLWTSQRGSHHFLTNWQGTGKNYQLFTKEQLGSLPAEYSARAQHAYNCPDKGLTLAQCWGKYGMSVWGDMLLDAQAVMLDGVSGFAREGTTTTLGPPSAIIASPTSRESAFVFAQEGYGQMMRLYAVLSGDPAQAPGPILVSIDGGDPFPWGPTPVESPLDDSRVITIPAVKEGVHSVRTWRTDASGTPIGASVMSFPNALIVGPIPTPPICVPPQVLQNGKCVMPTPTTTTVPNVVGMTEAAARAAIVGAKLKIGMVSSAADPAPAGQVFRQIPDAGLTASIDSAVNLNISTGPAVIPTAPAGAYSYICDAAGNCKLTFIPK